MKAPKTLRSLFSQHGFVAEAKLHGVVGDRYARVIRLTRRKKQAFVLSAGSDVEVDTTSMCIVPATFRWPVGASFSNLSVGGCGVRGAAPCL